MRWIALRVIWTEKLYIRVNQLTASVRAGANPLTPMYSFPASMGFQPVTLNPINPNVQFLKNNISQSYSDDNPLPITHYPIHIRDKSRLYRDEKERELHARSHLR